MCGLVALFRRHGEPVSAGEIRAMRDLLVHRGPDGSGIHLDGEVGLGFRRLSIIDPKGGDQPMANARGTVHLVFNGEIYNYRSLRGLLLSRGVELRTQSDTETIVGLYELFGPRCVDYLHGMFAFVLWDAEERVLVAARDRLGIKPLYLLRRGETVAFASEVKAFLPLREWTPELAAETVPEYLTYRSLALPRTMFRDVERVLPGELVVVSAGAVRRERYWSLPDPGAGPPPARRAAESDWVDELDALLARVVAEHLVSDVPLGTFNSGGVDSSLVTALAARAGGGGGALNTYSVGFAEAAYDESPYAELVAARFATRHHRLLVGGEEYAEWLPRAIWVHDEPLDHPHSVHLLRLAHLARREVTVVLTGEGADELFGGYRRYLLPALLDRYPLPASWLRLAVGGLSGSGQPPLERLRALAFLGDGGGLRVEGLAAFASEAEVRRLLVAAPAGEIAGRGRHVAADVAAAGAAGRPSLLAQTLWLDQQTYLQSLLNRLDRMMMAASVEGRVPFLDHRIVELAARAPAHLKVRGRETKRLVKQVGRRHLPAAIIDRRKAGFAVPIARWLRPGGPLDAAMESLLAPGAAVHAHLDAARLRQLVGEHRSGERDHRELLWAAINLETWHRVWSDAARSAAATASTITPVADGLALAGEVGS